MQNKSYQRRVVHEINAGSMADIAFLLLIFFLVTTTIIEESGILVKLPIWTDEPVQVNNKNVLNVFINKANKILLEGHEVGITQIKDEAMNFILNPEKNANKADSPEKAIIALQMDRGTLYESYLSVYDQLYLAYNEIRDIGARADYKVVYDKLSRHQKRLIRTKYPILISESEPRN